MAPPIGGIASLVVKKRILEKFGRERGLRE
jgi:hypothetical protein